MPVAAYVLAPFAGMYAPQSDAGPGLAHQTLLLNVCDAPKAQAGQLVSLALT